MRLEEIVGKLELRAAVRHMEGEVGAECTAAVVGAREINEVAARLPRAGSVCEALFERQRRWSRVATEVVLVRRVDQRAIAKGDGIAQSQIGRWRGGQSPADEGPGHQGRSQYHDEGNGQDQPALVQVSHELSPLKSCGLPGQPFTCDRLLGYNER